MLRNVYAPLHDEFAGHPRVVYTSAELIGNALSNVRVRIGVKTSFLVSRSVTLRIGISGKVPATGEPNLLTLATLVQDREEMKQAPARKLCHLDLAQPSLRSRFSFVHFESQRYR